MVRDAISLSGSVVFLYVSIIQCPTTSDISNVKMSSESTRYLDVLTFSMFQVYSVLHLRI